MLSIAALNQLFEQTAELNILAVLSRAAVTEAIGGRSKTGGSGRRQRQCVFAAEGDREQRVPASSRKVRRRARENENSTKGVAMNCRLDGFWTRSVTCTDHITLHVCLDDQSHAELYLPHLFHRRGVSIGAHTPQNTSTSQEHLFVQAHHLLAFRSVIPKKLNKTNIIV